MHKPDSTADFRKYPKGPNFLLIVVLAGVVMIGIFIAAWFLLHGDAKRLVPHPANPTPNSMLQSPSGSPALAA